MPFVKKFPSPMDRELSTHLWNLTAWKGRMDPNVLKRVNEKQHKIKLLPLTRNRRDTQTCRSGATTCLGVPHSVRLGVQIYSVQKRLRDFLRVLTGLNCCLWC